MILSTKIRGAKIQYANYSEPLNDKNKEFLNTLVEGMRSAFEEKTTMTLQKFCTKITHTFSNMDEVAIWIPY